MDALKRGENGDESQSPACTTGPRVGERTAPGKRQPGHGRAHLPIVWITTAVECSGIGHSQLILRFSWDSNNPAGDQPWEHDGFTGSLVSSNYFAKAGQYGVARPPSRGRMEPASCAAAVIAGVTDFISISLWMECETAPGLTDYPRAHRGSQAGRQHCVRCPTPYEHPDQRHCVQQLRGFGAYHFFGSNLVWTTEMSRPPFVIPFSSRRASPTRLSRRLCDRRRGNPLDG